EIQYYRRFSPDGLAFQLDFGLGVAYGTPTIRMSDDLVGSVPEAVATVTRRLSGQPADRPSFFVFRTILKAPSWHRDVARGVEERLGADRVELVDMHTLFELIKLVYGEQGQ